jgi:hypothetical protein
VTGKIGESSSLNYMESDTMWINPKAANSQLIYGAPQHLYINNLYPPEYAELDQGSRHQHDTCYASTNLLDQPYNQVQNCM